MIKRTISILTFITLVSLSLYSENFKFTFSMDKKYRILSTVKEDVYINEQLSHKADILNKISVHIVHVNNGKGLLDVNFITSESASDKDKVFEFSHEYSSKFYMDENGRYDVPPEYFMPVVRDVPIFPDKEIYPGDSWSAIGEEVHDFRESFGISKPFRFPIYVNYTYLGKADYKGADYDLISINYNVFIKPKIKESVYNIYPIKITGKSNQLLYWNNVAGRTEAYEEEFEFHFEMSNGDVVGYTGIANAHVIESKIMDKSAVVKEIEEKLLTDAVKDMGVSESDEGVKIVMSNIQFKADSSILLDQETAKLDRIVEILEKYPERDILIKGHTAMAGTSIGRLELSKQRAKAVADYFLKKNFRSDDQITIKGVGAKEPIADNSTPEGMQKNRRVEIIILEN